MLLPFSISGQYTVHTFEHKRNRESKSSARGGNGMMLDTVWYTEGWVYKMYNGSTVGNNITWKKEEILLFWVKKKQQHVILYWNTVSIYCCGRMHKWYIAYSVCLFPVYLLLQWFTAICAFESTWQSSSTYLCFTHSWLHHLPCHYHFPLLSRSPTIRSARLNKAGDREAHVRMK